MSAHPLRPLHVAFYEALTDHAGLMGMVGGVFDTVPAGAVLPYVVIEESVARRWPMLGRQAFRCETWLAVYSRQGGRKELMEIVALLQAVLHHQPLAVEGYDVAAVEVIDCETEQQKDGVTAQARVRVRTQLMEAV